jgi:hypothetical protein
VQELALHAAGGLGRFTDADDALERADQRVRHVPVAGAQDAVVDDAANAIVGVNIAGPGEAWPSHRLRSARVASFEQLHNVGIGRAVFDIVGHEARHRRAERVGVEIKVDHRLPHLHKFVMLQGVPSLPAEIPNVCVDFQ